MIATQLGRRNLTPEQKSYLRGKRYNLEKKAEGRPEKRLENQDVSGRTVVRLAEEYHVSPSTIEADAKFADAVDVLEDQVRSDIREVVLKRQRNGTGKMTKKQATRAGKLVQERTVAPLPFMRREGWKPYQVLEAIEVLGTFPQPEHAALNTFLDRPFIPAEEGLEMLRNLYAHTADQRHPPRRDQRRCQTARCTGRAGFPAGAVGFRVFFLEREKRFGASLFSLSQRSY
jgi:hypothetical protein